MMKNMDNELRGLEERCHKGEKVRRHEMVEAKMKLSIAKMLLYEQVDKDQWYGWKLRKKIKCLVKELYERKLRHKMSGWLKKEEAELNGTKYGKRSMEVYISGPKQGPILGEDNERDKYEERPDECLK